MTENDDERALGTPSGPRASPLVPGDSAPFFFLRTPAGEELSLAAEILRGPVVLEFIRGSWDPDARRRLDELDAIDGELLARNVRVAVVTCERIDPLAAFLEQTKIRLSVAVDEDRSVTKAYGVFRRFALPVWNIARPSTFVIDRCGFVRYAYVAPLSIHAAPLDEVRAALDKLEG